MGAAPHAAHTSTVVDVGTIILLLGMSVLSISKVADWRRAGTFIGIELENCRKLE